MARSKGKSLPVGKIVGYALSVLIGGFFLVLGAAYFDESSEGLSDAELITGKLTVVAPATDNALGLTDMGPVMYRNARMYQWVKDYVEVNEDGHTKKEYYGSQGFSSDHQREFSAYKDRSAARTGWGFETTFTNPEFPEAFQNSVGGGDSVIYGEVQIGDEGITLDESLLQLFGTSECGLDKYIVPAYNDPDEAGTPYGLLHVGKGMYSTKKGNDWEIGDLMVEYSVIDPEILQEEFTAIGQLDGKVLKRDGDRGGLYNRIVTWEEAEKDFKHGQTKTGVILVIVGVVILGLGIFLTKNLL